MAGIKISQLVDGGSIGIADQVAVARGAETFKIPLKQVVTTGENIGITTNTGQIYAGENETSTTSLRFRSLSGSDGIRISNVGNNVVVTGKQTAFVSDVVPPSGFESGTLWFNSSSSDLFVYYNDGDSQQWINVLATNGTALVADSVPLGAENGTLWFNSSSSDLSIYYDDGDSGQWLNVFGGSDVSAIVSDGEPTAPENGTLWFNSSSADLFVYYNDGDSAQWLSVLNGEMPWAPVPSLSSSPGTQGQIAYNNNFFYVCVADNTWKRTTLTSW
jgi:hypothetical protein